MPDVMNLTCATSLRAHLKLALCLPSILIYKHVPKRQGLLLNAWVLARESERFPCPLVGSSENSPLRAPGDDSFLVIAHSTDCHYIHSGLMETLPDELWEKIFSYLESEELWSCLGVSQRWRRIANSNILWKKICDNVGIDVEPHPSLGPPYLCDWASAFYLYYLLPIKNWKRESNKTIYSIQLDDMNFIDAWNRTRGAIYYFKTDKLTVYELYPHGLASYFISPVFFNVERDYYNISICLNNTYIAVSSYNLVLIYKKLYNKLYPYKIVSFTEDEVDVEGNCKASELVRMFSKKAVLKVKAVANDFLWLSDNFGEHYIIVNLITDNVRMIPKKSNFLYSCYSPFIAIWDDDVNLYDFEGNVLLKLNKSVWDVCFNSKLLVLGNKETQSVETWRIRSNEHLISKNVLYHTDMAIHPKKNLMVLAEKSIDLYRFTCIDAINGTVLWRVTPPSQQSRCHLMQIHSEYVFIWHSYLSRPTYNILDIDRGGKFIGAGLLSQNKTYIFTCFWVSQECSSFKIVSFIENRAKTTNTAP